MVIKQILLFSPVRAYIFRYFLRNEERKKKFFGRMINLLKFEEGKKEQIEKNNILVNLSGKEEVMFPVQPIMSDKTMTRSSDEPLSNYLSSNRQGSNDLRSNGQLSNDLSSDGQVSNDLSCNGQEANRQLDKKEIERDIISFFLT